ncbi:Solute carrier family 35 member G1 [Holothuria leucospilota]|uniref:Solute carrier family 35 member G1 n=1 Tax=Holothuria leucospilota TaxID=206669 RepID=A0A9Q1CNY2_HOLLE|nr:Solute carrier family 35 member G1 [Holothuria leucospilota]
MVTEKHLLKEHGEGKNLQEEKPRQISSTSPEIPGLSNLSKGKIVAVITTVMYGLTNVSIKMATEIVHPNEVTLITGLALLLGSGCIFLTKPSEKISWQNLLISVFSGMILFLTMTLENVAFGISRAGDVVAVQYSSEVLMSGVIAYLFLGERFGIYFILLSFLSIAGVFLVIQPPFLFPFEDKGLEKGSQISGMLLALTSGSGFSVLYTVVRYLSHTKCPFDHLIFLDSIILVVGPIFLITWTHTWKIPQTPLDWLTFLFAGSLEAFALIMTLWAIQKDPVLFVSLILTFEVVVTYVVEYFIFHTVPTLLTTLGALFIFISCLGIIVYGDSEDEETGDQFYWVPPFEPKYQLIIVPGNR